MNKYKYWLYRMTDSGDATVHKLLNVYKDARSIYEACSKKDERFLNCVDKKIVTDVIEKTKRYDLDKEYTELINGGIRFLSEDDREYPERLKQIKDHPYAIYVKGKIPEDDVSAVAIIGARECSEYGRFIASSFGSKLGEAGVNIISGMARGVDGISQKGALDSGGSSFGVLGTGVDVCYPLENRELYLKLQEKGGLISPFSPGEGALKWHFPYRNRIVAGLSDLILVVEARQRSGTSITVNMALGMGKDVYAVPGRLTDRLSDGCNTLIRDGAGIALSPEDVIRELAVIWEKKHPAEKKTKTDSILNGRKLTLESSSEEGILRFVDINPLSGEEIHKRRLSKEPGADIKETLNCLIMLCIEGKVTQIGTGYFYKNYKT